MGLQHRVFRGDEDTGAAVVIDLDIKIQTGKKIGAINTHPLEVFGGCQSDPDLVFVQTTDIEQVDLCPERFVQVRTRVISPGPLPSTNLPEHTPVKNYSSKLSSHTDA